MMLVLGLAAQVLDITGQDLERRISRVTATAVDGPDERK